MRPAIDEALDFVEKIFTGDASFLQLAKHSNKMMIESAKVNAMHHLNPVLSALAQLASADVAAD